MGILRLAHVDIRTTDLDLASAYYSEVMGLFETERDDDHVYFKAWDEIDHHSLRLRYDSRIGLDKLCFKVEAEDDLADLERRIEAYGLPVSRVSDGESVGQGESLQFDSPSGHRLEFVHDVEKVGNLLGKRNPGVVPQNLAGIAPPRLDHCLVTTEEVGEVAKFFMDVLGFSMSEQLIDGNGHPRLAFMQRSGRPHDIAFVQGPNGGFHHFAYWLDDWDHVRKAADILAYNGIGLDIGPTRHGMTRGHTIYFFDPLGVRNEVFTGGYRCDPDFPTITWTEDNLGRAAFYYEGEVNRRFLTVFS